MRNLNPNAVPLVDRPVSEKNLSSVGNFFGLYGGEHIAATEFVIGATLVAWGCSAKSIILGLIIGNILAMLSFTFCCATLGTSTRLTLYSYLKKILGPHAQKVYNLVWSLCSITLAASGICVSSTAIRETVGIPIQHEWYPTHIGFPIIVVILGIIVTIVAANGFDACAKFSSTCVPWMIAICIVEHYLFPKIGYTRFWSMYKEQAEYAAFEQALKELVDRDAEAALAAGENKPVKNAGFTTVLSVIAYIVLAGIVVIALMTYMGSMTVVTFKSIAFILTICYFVLNGISTFIKYRNEAVVRQ